MHIGRFLGAERMHVACTVARLGLPLARHRHEGERPIRSRRRWGSMRIAMTGALQSVIRDLCYFIHPTVRRVARTQARARMWNSTVNSHAC